jgi:hypothetical protein
MKSGSEGGEGGTRDALPMLTCKRAKDHSIPATSLGVKDSTTASARSMRWSKTPRMDWSPRVSLPNEERAAETFDGV